MHDQHGVHATVIGHDVDRGQEVFRRGIAAQIHRIAPRQADIQLGLEQRLAAILAQLGQLAAARHQLVDGQQGRAQPIGDDRQPITAQRLHAIQRLQRIEHVFAVIDAHHPGTREGNIDDPVAIGHPTCDMCAEQVGFRGTATLDRQHQPIAGRLAQRGHEVHRVVNALQVQQQGL